MSEYRIDELARAANSTVRNVRAYQERGLLPPPRREGRVGIYDGTHLARLQLIGRLLHRGYTASNIAELLRAWQDGRDLADVLGLEQVVTSFFAQELPETITCSELLSLLSPSDGEPSEAQVRELVRAAADVGLIELPPGGHLAEHCADFRVPSPRLLRTTADLIAAGVPTSEVLSLGAQVRRAVDDTARRFVEIMSDYLFRSRAPGWMPSPGEVPAVAAFIDRIRPATAGALQASLALALDHHVDAAFGEYIDRLSSHLSGRNEDSV
ncbi:MerR HTH family regulatory protein [Pseudonocardia ammonioxydans]|uniref:MerR HTH family regulatory protein n=1 Tax=Pseudonocardia ammonioxydans TaxID=260086 RepID=A0A1I5HA44_PSUAM|nr:MerR family transcriptional regulator [Pseudonocardia ammonioxydans]SFO44876.1 MerR HTH family regulatory protein [Pseudonocardia ammonioxydans]